MQKTYFIWGSSLWLLLGLVGIAAGLIFSILGISIMLKGDIKTGGIVGSLFGLLPLSLGIWLTVRIVKHLQEKKFREIEKNIIATTIEHGGRITPIELTLKLDISLEEAQEELDLLTQKDIFELEISEDGVLFYYLKKNLSRGSNK